MSEIFWKNDNTIIGFGFGMNEKLSGLNRVSSRRITLTDIYLVLHIISNLILTSKSLVFCIFGLWFL